MHQVQLPHALFAVFATPGTTQRTHVSSLPCIRLKRSWRRRNRVGIAGGSATTTLATLATLLQLYLHLLRLLFTPTTMFSMQTAQRSATLMWSMLDLQVFLFLIHMPKSH